MMGCLSLFSRIVSEVQFNVIETALTQGCGIPLFTPNFIGFDPSTIVFETSYSSTDCFSSLLDGLVDDPLL